MAPGVRLICVSLCRLFWYSASHLSLQRARENLGEWKRLRQPTAWLGGVDDTGVEFAQVPLLLLLLVLLLLLLLLLVLLCCFRCHYYGCCPISRRCASSWLLQVQLPCKPNSHPAFNEHLHPLTPDSIASHILTSPHSLAPPTDGSRGPGLSRCLLRHRPERLPLP